MSSMRGSAGFPIGVNARYTKPLVSAHFASTKRGKVTNGVVMGRFAGSTQVGADTPPVGRKGWRNPVPPRSDAGFVQAAFHPSRADPPKRLFGGGGAEARN